MITLLTFAVLNSQLTDRMATGQASQPIRYNLRRQLRTAAPGVTIREIAAHMQITLKRVREVGSLSQVPYLVALDFQDAIEAVAYRKAAQANRAALVAILPAAWRKHIRVATMACPKAVA